MVELSLKEAFEYQMRHTSVKHKKPVTGKHIEEKGGLEYLRKLKQRGNLKKDAALIIGCRPDTIGEFLKRKGTSWSEL